MTSIPSIAVDLRACLADPTGIGVYTRSLLIALSAHGRYRLVGMAQRPPDDGAWLAEHGINLDVQPAPSGVIWQQWGLPRRLRRGDIDLLWSPLQTSPAFGPTPTVVTVHDLTTLLLPQTHRLKVRLSQRPLLRRSLVRAKRIVAISRTTAADLQRMFPATADKVRIVYNGVDRAFQPADSPSIAAIRAELGVPEGYVLYVGTLEPRKNVNRLLDAWEILDREAGGVPPLLVVGPYGWKSRDLTRRLERLRARGVHHLGALERDRLIRVVQAATVFVYPSLYEGFGLPPAEAMACAVPVVVSDRSSLPEVVGDAGVTVDPEHPAAIARAIRDLLDDDTRRDRVARAGFERIATFTWERAATSLAEVFDEVLAGREAA